MMEILVSQRCRDIYLYRRIETRVSRVQIPKESRHAGKVRWRRYIFKPPHLPLPIHSPTPGVLNRDGDGVAGGGCGKIFVFFRVRYCTRYSTERLRWVLDGICVVVRPLLMPHLSTYTSDLRRLLLLIALRYKIISAFLLVIE